MSERMGTFRTTIEIENPARRGERRALENVLVDTGAELSWVPGDHSRVTRHRAREAAALSSGERHSPRALDRNCDRPRRWNTYGR
jgi:hypothetical protein